jgi:hypothetical protein
MTAVSARGALGFPPRGFFKYNKRDMRMAGAETYPQEALEAQLELSNRIAQQKGFVNVLQL